MWACIEAPDAGQAQDPLVDVGLGGGLVIAVVGLRGREEADLARLEVALLRAGGGDDDLVRAVARPLILTAMLPLWLSWMS